MKPAATHHQPSEGGDDVPFHVRLTLQGDDRDEIKLGATRAFLRDRILSPYAAGQHITVNGRTFGSYDVSRIRITYTTASVDEVHRKLVAEAMALGEDDLDPTAADIAAAGVDLTDEFILGPPGAPTSTGQPAQQHGEP